MEARDDIHYIERVLSGDTGAFSCLVDRHKDMVFTIALKIARNREDAEEIAQDVFVKAYQKLGSFRKDSRFSTWLYRIAYNEAITGVRKRKVITEELHDEIAESLPEHEIENEIMGLDPSEQQMVLGKILDMLPPEDQLLVTLFYMHDQPVSEISEVTGLSGSNVKVRLHRIRKRIYSELDKVLKRIHSTR